MRKLDQDRRKLTLLATVMTASLVGACSSDVARFDPDPFQNPFRQRTTSEPASTGSINRARTAAQQHALAAVPAAPVATQNLPPVGQPILGANPAATGSVAAANYPALAPTAARGQTVLGSAAGWTAAGGTPITLQPGEGINTLSTRYGVPPSAILAVNGLSSVNQAQPGQQIIIPAYNAVQGAQSNARAGAASVIQRPQPGAVAQAAPVAAAAPARAIPPARNITPALESDAEKRAAAKLKELKAPKPAAKPADEDDDEESPKSAPAKKKAETAKPAPGKAADDRKSEAKRVEDRKADAQAKADAEHARAEADKHKVAKATPTRKARPDDEPVTTASIPEAKAPTRIATAPARPESEKDTSPAASEADNASFRWPAKGRVISGFGARGTGGANDGINIALPEGTPVRAAEGGTVVHADDALKGYGKLVLIRHPNGYVSVYAHNGELKVKRGESVKRGQVIASSGQSGNVTAPQLHFEIRKGATPVDPTKHLGE